MVLPSPKYKTLAPPSVFRKIYSTSYYFGPNYGPKFSLITLKSLSNKAEKNSSSNDDTSRRSENSLPEMEKFISRDPYSQQKAQLKNLLDESGYKFGILLNEVLQDEEEQYKEFKNQFKNDLGFQKLSENEQKRIFKKKQYSLMKELCKERSNEYSQKVPLGARIPSILPETYRGYYYCSIREDFEGFFENSEPFFTANKEFCPADKKSPRKNLESNLKEFNGKFLNYPHKSMRNIITREQADKFLWYIASFSSDSLPQTLTTKERIRMYLFALHFFYYALVKTTDQISTYSATRIFFYSENLHGEKTPHNLSYSHLLFAAAKAVNHDIEKSVPPKDLIRSFVYFFTFELTLLALYYQLPTSLSNSIFNNTEFKNMDRTEKSLCMYGFACNTYVREKFNKLYRTLQSLVD